MERFEGLRARLKEARQESLAHLSNGCKVPALTELLLWQEVVEKEKTLLCDIRLIKGVTGIQATLSVPEECFKLHVEGADVLDALLALERAVNDPGSVKVPYVSKDYERREKARQAKKT
jgi:hypothetical protein